eukprot:CAMPEP_0170177644 /NCGR_PEP_ID=MMETSP0040_2-20121228/10674_1 /TAXON_ID=641309 /ORGANISM="Lotharella oceanica, Strain CCMP622" /LENGTH=138 /DNA_ID=CAMNT_0010420347 /DNA_START=16 /DNA_END=432 /DNA_ORIENTATION=+
MADNSKFANIRTGRFSVHKFTGLPSDLKELRNMSESEKDRYVEKELHDHKRAICREFEVTRHQTLLQTIIRNCFNHCVINPGKDLTLGQKRCLSDCTENLLEYQSSIMQMLFEKSVTGQPRIPGPFVPEDEDRPRASR